MLQCMEGSSSAGDHSLAAECLHTAPSRLICSVRAPIRFKLDLQGTAFLCTIGAKDLWQHLGHTTHIDSGDTGLLLDQIS